MWVQCSKVSLKNLASDLVEDNGHHKTSTRGLLRRARVPTARGPQSCDDNDKRKLEARAHGHKSLPHRRLPACHNCVNPSRVVGVGPRCYARIALKIGLIQTGMVITGLAVLTLGSACAPRSVPDNEPASSPASAGGEVAPASHVTYALDSDPPLPGSNAEGWGGLSANDAGAPGTHQHHHGHAHGGASNEAMP